MPVEALVEMMVRMKIKDEDDDADADERAGDDFDCSYCCYA